MNNMPLNLSAPDLDDKLTKLSRIVVDILRVGATGPPNLSIAVLSFYLHILLFENVRTLFT